MVDRLKVFIKSVGIIAGAYAGYEVLTVFIKRLCELLGDTQGAEEFSLVVGIGLIILALRLAGAITKVKPKKIKEELTRKRNISGRRLVYKKYAHRIPHFGQMLDPRQILEVVKKDKFVPYVNPGGETIDRIKVNETDKWVRILDQYFPLDLIYGYNIDRNVLYAIDGTELELPKELRRKNTDHELERFLKERGCFHECKLENDFTHFFEVFPGYLKEFPKADWSYIRYKWEKAVALENSSDIAASPGYREFFETVLSKTELEAVAREIYECRKELPVLLNSDSYANEYTLCNGIELLGMLSEPSRLKGIDFLFECLSDADEACFRLAVPLILRLPKEKLTLKIEERTRQAYLNKDALRLAGLLYISKELGYKIEYIENLKGALPYTEPTNDFEEGRYAYLRE